MSLSGPDRLGLSSRSEAPLFSRTEASRGAPSELDFLLQAAAYQSVIITTTRKWYVLCSISAKQRTALTLRALCQKILPDIRKDSSGNVTWSGVRVCISAGNIRGIEKLLEDLREFYSVIAVLDVP